MPKLRIESEHGALKTVNLDCPVENPAELEQIQRLLGHLLPDLAAKPVADFHLTIFDFGRLEGLWLELQRVNPDLDFENCYRWFMELLAEVQGTFVGPYTLFVKGLAAFGVPDEPTLVVELILPIWLAERRSNVTAATANWLMRCGVTDVPAFMRASHNLHYQLAENFRPHVSLGRLSHPDPIPAISGLRGLSFRFGPSYLRNVEMLSE